MPLIMASPSLAPSTIGVSPAALSTRSAGAKGAAAGTSKLCGGLFYARATPRTLAFAAAWERRVAAPGAGAKNQPHFNAALDAARLPLRLLPCDLFPNGYRYASDAWRAAQRRRPVLVHNNWIKGHAAKRERFERWGLWTLIQGP